MSYLLDTNVISELIAASPDHRVESWLAGIDEDALFVSVITLGELRYGIELLATGRRRDRLEEWFTEALLPRFEGRVLPVTDAVADLWGRIKASARSAGRQLTPADSLIAATAFCHDLALVTRNTADFRTAGVELFNPWLSEAE